MKGAYLLIMELSKGTDIRIGSKAIRYFPAGFYCYVGSAMNSLEKRISRHLSTKKRLHWHIDWFLLHARIIEVKRIESNKNIECIVSQGVAQLAEGVPMPGFGSSDCTVCRSHLYYFSTNPSDRLEKLVKEWKI